MVQMSDLATPEGIKAEKATLGGFTPLKSGLYKMKVKAAFIHPSKGGALGLNLHFVGDKGELYRETLWIRSGNAKENKTYYVRDGVKHLLPGMEVANAIGQLTLGKDISQLEATEKVYDVYNSDTQSEQPTKVQDLLELHGEDIVLGIKHNIVNKNVKNGDGVYVATNETRDENVIDRVFSAETGMIVQEMQEGAADAVFVHGWQEKWEGKTTDKSTKVAAANVPGSTTTAVASGAPAAPALFPAKG